MSAASPRSSARMRDALVCSRTTPAPWPTPSKPRSTWTPPRSARGNAARAHLRALLAEGDGRGRARRLSRRVCTIVNRSLPTITNSSDLSRKPGVWELPHSAAHVPCAAQERTWTSGTDQRTLDDRMPRPAAATSATADRPPRVERRRRLTPAALAVSQPESRAAPIRRS